MPAAALKKLIHLSSFSGKGQGATMGLKAFNAIFNRIEDISASIAGVLIVFALLSVAIEVVVRYFFGKLFLGLFEIVEFSMLFIPMLGTAWLLRYEGHINIDIVANALSPRNRVCLKIVVSALETIVSTIITYYAIITTWSTYVRGVETWGVVIFPKYYTLLPIPIGFLLLSIEALRRFFVHFGELKKPITIQFGEKSETKIEGDYL